MKQDQLLNYSFPSKAPPSLEDCDFPTFRLSILAMVGFLVPDTYVVVAPSLNDLLIASIIWGFTLATGVFSGTKAFKQTWATWRRSRRLHAYAYMIWAEWIVSMVIGVLSWVFIRGLIEPSVPLDRTDPMHLRHHH
ncbi:hypothetical protein AUP68_10824 [Ilyonectria robusta]